MNKTSSFARFALAAAVPLLILLALPIKPMLLRRFGSEVTLQVLPVDPRDIFRGDYVALRLAAAEIPTELFADTPTRGEEWFVALRPNADGVSEAVRVERSRPDKPYLTGRVTQTGQKTTLDYGPSLTRYYVHENAGRAIEEAAQKGAVRIKVSLLCGMAVITDLIMDELSNK